MRKEVVHESSAGRRFRIIKTNLIKLSLDEEQSEVYSDD